MGHQGFDWLASRFGNVFDGITCIRTVLDWIEVLLIGTPVVMVVIVVAIFACRYQVAIFTAASLAYLAMMGLWEISMITVARRDSVSLCVGRHSAGYMVCKAPVLTVPPNRF